jgi:hypothetical protein
VSERWYAEDGEHMSEAESTCPTSARLGHR